ncbi:hypothetical protein FJZ19_02600 [Candidatus Pacearchaeota archaeon]|nr:hypothetical protein [Candidatus Pacearchaeota archaeon]
MGWFDIFKKKEKEEKETIKFEQLKKKLEQEISKIEENKKEARKKIITEISDFNSQIEEKISNLEKININSRKEQEKIKLVVKENLVLYINYLKKLVSDLNSSENLENEEYIRRINQITYNFEKNSRNAFEKATILIGKELGEARYMTKNLFSEINDILKNNFSEKEKELRKIIGLFDKIDESERNLGEINMRFEHLEEKKEKISQEKIKKEKELGEFKNTEEYKKDAGEKEKKKQEQEKINKDIFELKQKIDLRKLGKLFHNDLKKSEIIKIYSENFKQALEKDEKLEILNIAQFDEAYIKSLKDRIQKILIIESEIDRKIGIIEEEIRKLASEFSGIQREIIDEENKKEKLGTKKKQINQEIIKNSEAVLDIIVD